MHGTALTVSLWQQVQEWDQRLFLFFNHKLANPLFDAVLPFLREAVLWVPLYLFIVVFVVLNWGKKGLLWCGFFIATVALADLLGTYAFKEIIRRLRPCNEPSLAGQVRLVISACPGGYSFVSNHAANHFGLATFMVLTYQSIFRKWVYLAYAWATVICFAQLYVGVHYPLDILGGALLGVLAGYLMAFLYHHNFGRLSPVI